MPKKVTRTSNSCPCAAKFETAGWRLHASGFGKQTSQTWSGKHFLLLKKINKISIFVKLFPLSFHLSAFEVTFIKTSNLALCRQTELVYSLRIVHKWRSLIGTLPGNHYWLFSAAAPFPATSILTILLDKCHVKSFDEINIWLKWNFFAWKTCFGKKLLVNKKHVFEKHNSKKTFFCKKTNCYLKPKIFFEKNFLFWNFFLQKNFFTSGA